MRSGFGEERASKASGTNAQEIQASKEKNEVKERGKRERKEEKRYGRTKVVAAPSQYSIAEGSAYSLIKRRALFIGRRRSCSRPQVQVPVCKHVPE